MPTPQQYIETINTYLTNVGTPSRDTLDKFYAARSAVSNLTFTGWGNNDANPRTFAAAGMFEKLLTLEPAADAWFDKQVALAKASTTRLSESFGLTRLRNDASPLRETMLDHIAAYDAWLLTPNNLRGLTPWVASPSAGAEAVAHTLRNDPNPNVQRKLLTMLVSMPWPTSWTQEFLVNRRLFDDYIERLGASKYDFATRTGLQNLAVRARDAFRRPETFTAMEAVTGGGGGGGAGDRYGGGSSGGPKATAWYHQSTTGGALLVGLAVGVLWSMHR